MNRLITLTLALAAVALVNTSCKKDTDVTTPSGILPSTLPCLDKRMMISSFTMDPAVDLNGDGRADTDLLAFMEPCEKDNTLMFEKGGKLTGDNGARRCRDDVTQTESAGTWTYDEPTKTLRITSPTDKNDVSDWKVLEATSNQLNVQTVFVEEGVSYKGTLTWKAV